MGSDKTPNAGEPKSTLLEAMFTFSVPRIRAKAARFFTEAQYEFRLQGAHVARVRIEGGNLSMLIAQLGGVLSYYELTKTKFVTVKQTESETGCEVFRLRTLDQLICFPSQHRDVMQEPARRAGSEVRRS